MRLILFLFVATSFGAFLARPGYSQSIDSGALFEQLDVNRDGFVDATEAPSDKQALFARLVHTSDENNDGRLTRDEFVAALEPVRVAKTLPTKPAADLPGSDALLALIANLDANGDGVMRPGEATGRFTSAFERLREVGDGDRDGTLTQREVSQAAPRLTRVAQRIVDSMRLDVPAELAKLSPRQRRVLEGNGDDPTQARRRVVRQLLQRFDKNDDRLLTPDEAPPRLKRQFSRYDFNQDQALDVEEIAIAAQQMRGAADASDARPGRRRSASPTRPVDPNRAIPAANDGQMREAPETTSDAETSDVEMSAPEMQNR
ncbi:MAG: hypothetical protein KDA61_16575 [Planctomycetales bacterium]|nr:hypothetical protein [Planctomycetales bacterium]